MNAPTKSTEVFVSYADADKEYLDQLKASVCLLEREGLITTWHNRLITPGTDWAKEIDAHLETAQLILLLVSPDFIASDYCYQIEMQRALERHNANEARVVPIIVRPCDWEHSSIGHLQVLPEDEMRIKMWDSQRQIRDQAWLDVTIGIRRVIEDLCPNPSHPSSSLVFNIPSPRNPIFTGREEILKMLADALKTGQATAITQSSSHSPQAISGLGGIGKTQIAIEYAYQHRQDYQAVLWTMADSHETLSSGYVAIAQLLNLPEKDEKDQNTIVKAVKDWLAKQNGWLLILDNADSTDNLKNVKEFLPLISNGHILITTRARAVGGEIRRINVDTMTAETGALFLLRRAKLIDQHAELQDATNAGIDVTKAQGISNTLGGLPLALDQAGAYIEQTECSLTKYLNLYQTCRFEMLNMHGGGDYPTPVTTTLSLSFEKVERKNAAAADLLRFCAFLHPDAISKEIVTAGAKHLSPHLQKVAREPLLFDNAIAALLNYSLVHCNNEKETLNIHRLVQAVIQDTMGRAKRHSWARRTILALNKATPNQDDVAAYWDACEQWLPHALECAKWIMKKPEPEWIPHKESADLLYHAGRYQCQRAEYNEAKPLHKQALSLRERVLGGEHQDVANSLSALAMLEHDLGFYEGKVLEMVHRALEIREKVFGKESPQVADSLDCLGMLHKAIGHYQEALPLSKRAHDIRTKDDKGSLEASVSMNNMAMLYKTLARYDEARPLLEEAYRIKKDKAKKGLLDPNDPSLATSMNNTAMLRHELGDYDDEVLKLCQEALFIREERLASEHLMVRSLGNMAELYRARGRYQEASSFCEKTLDICKQALKDTYPDKAHGLNTQAMLFYDLGRYREALPLLEEARRICQITIKNDHPDLAVSMNNLAVLYKVEGDTEEALDLFEEALTLKKRLLTPFYPHPALARCLNNLAMLYYNQGNYQKALPLCEEAHILFDLIFGPKHPDTATSLNNLAMLYHALGRYEEALPLYERALSVRKRLLGERHPDVATSINNLAMLSYDLGHSEKALSLCRKACLICEESLEKTYPHMKVIKDNFDYIQLGRQ